MSLNFKEETTPSVPASGRLKMFASSADHALYVEKPDGSLTALTARVVVAADAASITPNIDTSDYVTQANTQATGALTVNAPTGTPINKQRLRIQLTSTNVQNFAFNAAYVGSLQLTLPVSSSGATLTDELLFEYSTSATKWRLMAVNFGF